MEPPPAGRAREEILLSCPTSPPGLLLVLIEGNETTLVGGKGKISEARGWALGTELELPRAARSARDGLTHSGTDAVRTAESRRQ